MNEIDYYSYQTPIGIIYISAIDDAIVGCAFQNEFGTRYQETPTIQKAYKQIEEYFSHQRQNFDVKYRFITGTAFQRRVWEAMLKIPYGQTVSYQDVAQMIGSPKAYRAVGNAIHHNPMSFFFPCHRVIAAHGKLGGYGGEIDKKIFLLDLEGVHL